MKKTIPAWATLSASQLAKAQKQTQMSASSRPKMDAILIEAIKVRKGRKTSPLPAQEERPVHHSSVDPMPGGGPPPCAAALRPLRPGEPADRPFSPFASRRAIRKAGRRWSPSESTSSAGTLRWSSSGGGTS